MIITEIVPQKNTDRVNIFIDGEFSLGLTIFLAHEYSLKVGKFIDDELMEKLKEDDLFNNAKMKAFRYLSYKDRSIKEMEDYLLKKEYSPHIINLTISYMLDNDYLNDKRFAENFIQGKSKYNNYGPRKIKYDLMNKGIEKEIIDLCLDDFDEDLEEIIDLVNRKYEKLKDAQYNKQYSTIGGFLSRKGHSYDTIKKVMDAFRNRG